ncbi:gas vesicle protein GvpG [Micromonospora sp. NPDC047670]|uniref:gas vesicle protein GvpG n=1 Tax=Micromonospora sp. NPDC047670 TaxID=3364252 RepID=UPI00371656D4
MDILWTLLTLPYAPVRGLTAVVRVIAREAESRQRNPVDVRRELEALDAAEAAGEITAAERDRGQQQVLTRLTGGAGRPAPPRARVQDGEQGRGGDPAGDAVGARRGAGGPRRRAGTERARRVPRDGGEGGERHGGPDPRRRRPGA